MSSVSRTQSGDFAPASPRLEIRVAQETPSDESSAIKTWADPAVALEGLHFRWQGQDVDTLFIRRFTMAQGEQLFISGPSGSGKSTLLGLIAGILTPTRGSITVQGESIQALSSAERDRFRGDHIGFIFQQFNLVPYLSIVENVLIPVRFSKRRLSRACLSGQSPEQTAEELLRRLDLAPSLWSRPVNRLSIGQQQRVAAARALIGDPELIIADEPTSALDTNRREAFLQLLLEACERRKTSLLFVSHDVSLAHSFPARISMAELNEAHREEEA